MGDPLSIAASAAGLISLGIQVTQSLVDFYNAYKNRDSNLNTTTTRLESLLGIFQCLEKTLSDRKFQADEQGLIKNIETSIENCDELIQELQDECDKFTKTSTGIKTAARVAGRRVTYPFRLSTLQKLDEDINEIHANISSALDVLQFRDTRAIQDDVTQIKALLDLVRTSQFSANLRDWLKAPDATINHNAACAKKHPGTGAWLVKGPQFLSWLTDENSIIWLNGFAGSGKSVLCSTAIQSAFRHRSSNPCVGIAFFYFTFNDESKQDLSAMLRALLLQLSSQLQDGHVDLTQLHNSYKPGTPPTSVLIEYLRRLIQRFHRVYFLLDALDESPRNRARADVLNAIETMRAWNLLGLHLFITSRDELDIRESLNLSVNQQVTMQNAAANKDIADFISGQFDADRRLRKWMPYRDKIQGTLTERAKGVFRWVECQFKSLQTCPRSDDHLDRLLNSLPQSLDETYERMLCNVFWIEDARRILTLLCFSSRPLTVREVIDGIAVDINNSPGLSRSGRVQDSSDVCGICPGFIDIDREYDHTKESDDEEFREVVRIAHFSVQEYLESDRIQHQKAAMFSLTRSTAHAEIAQICLTYLLDQDLSTSDLNQSLLKEFPLARFAAMYWYHHYQNAAKHSPKLEDAILKLFTCQDSFPTWVKLYDADNVFYPYVGVNFNRALDDIATPIYYACLLGLEQTLHELLNSDQLEITTISDLPPGYTPSFSKQVNKQGGCHGNALSAAVYKGHVALVQMLLDHKADVNAQGGEYGNALQAAAYNGHVALVQMLLDHKADVNAQGGKYGSALQAAAYKDHVTMMQMLLDHKADVNAQDEKYGSALQAATCNGHVTMMQMLLDRKADVNAQGGFFGNALQAAAYNGHVTVVQMLLDHKADVNAQDGFYGSALQAAVYK
ncbi:MAG: hypothetical protein Q9191_004671, partial [Dirinaria sp. TL-2023a]